MVFRAVRLKHGEVAPWPTITHVRLIGTAADSPHGKRVVAHITLHVDTNGVVPIAQIEPGFPARKTRQLGARRGMEYDLRHMANERSAGRSAQDKGVLELGRME